MNYQKKAFIATTITLIGVSFFSLLFMSFTGTEQEGTVTILVENIRSSKGNIAIGVYKSQSAFSKEQPLKKIVFPKTNYNNKKLSVQITLPKGTYGLALLDDENENKKMDYRLAFPKEGYGFSNYYHKGWSKPNFDNFSFYHNGQASTVKITVQYF